MLYRAMGIDRISRFGYACSPDGIDFRERSELPVFETTPGNIDGRLGCEDPRVVRIEDRFLITYTLASVYPVKELIGELSEPPWRTRVALAETTDFQSFVDFGVVLPEFDSKDAVLFPEKVAGQYVLLHRVYPDIWISFSDNLRDWSGHVSIAKPRKDLWDSVKIGAGAPPIRTPFGWFLVYHGVDTRPTYRTGWMLLDLVNPSHVIARSDEPIFQPERIYEQRGLVDSVVFPTGLIEVDDKFLTYYGAGDQGIGLAVSDRDEVYHSIGMVAAKGNI